MELVVNQREADQNVADEMSEEVNYSRCEAEEAPE